MSSEQQIELPTPDDSSNGKAASGRPKVAKVGSRIGDPLSEESSTQLLTRVDIIRDPLHGDVRLTALERFLMDTPEFQRLRNVNQLAMTYMAYPGALHTRFLHSLGVLHVCSQMIETCNYNARNYLRLAADDHPVPVEITGYCTLLARLSALLHDLAHVPFGHSLEKEGKVFDVDEWQDKGRQEMLLGPNSDLVKRLKSYFNLIEVPDADNAASGVLADVRDILSAKEEDVHTLPYPFIHDLVGNTICADLIDYVQRDMYFCGLTETLGKRFLEYLAVMPVERDGKRRDLLQPIRHEGRSVFRTSQQGKAARMCRLVLLQYRYNERRSFVKKHDVVAEAVDLVRRRLTVAEKLYFHRTKMVASSMLITAASAAGLTAKKIWDLSDAEVLKDLASSENRRARVLARNLRERKLYKPIYRVSYCKQDPESVQSNRLWNERTGAYKRFSEPKGRALLIERLERLIGVEKCESIEEGIGTVSISCPDKDMNIKAFDMLVLPDPLSQITRLQDSGHGPTEMEIRAIQEAHRHLWRLEVYVDPEVVPLKPSDPFVSKLAGAIEHEVGLRNESATFRNVPSVDLGELEIHTFIASEVRSLGLMDKITHAHFSQLKMQRFRGAVPTADEVEEFLKSNGYMS